MPEKPPRHELKYFIARGAAPVLFDKLDRTLWRDGHGDDFNSYFIRSLYFDDPYDSAYHDKLDGVMNRDKYRIRVYGQSEGSIYVERKRKLGDLIQKDSVRITRRLAEQIIAGNPRGLEKLEAPLLRDVGAQLRLSLLRPSVVVDYDRQAFRHPAQRVRVTFDRDVRAASARGGLFSDVPMVPVLEAGKMILEVKYDHYLPDFIAPLLSTIPSERSAISKFVLCRRYI